MKRKFTYLLFSILLMIYAPITHAQSRITIGTGNLKLQFYAEGKKLCRAFNHKHPHYACLPVVTTGSLANMLGLANGSFNYALTQQDVFIRFPHHDQYRVLKKIFSSTFYVFVSKQSSIHSFKQLKGKRVNIGPALSGLQETMNIVTQALLGRHPYAKVFQVAAPKQLALLRQRKIDAIVFVLSGKSKVLQKTEKSYPLRVLAIKGPAIQKLIQQGLYRQVTVHGVKTIATEILLVEKNCKKACTNVQLVPTDHQ